jgi:hypothetical protein
MKLFKDASDDKVTRQPQQVSNQRLLALTPETFDPSRLVIADPVKRVSTVNGKEFENFNSQVYYKDQNGTNREFYVSLPPQRTFGVNLNYEFGKEESEETLNGAQMCYNLTSMQTVSNPTHEEQATIKLFDAITTALGEKAFVECETNPLRIPPGIKSSIKMAKLENKPEDVIKPIAEYPKNPQTKKFDLTKPKRVYLQLATKGKGTKLEINTRIKGPGNKLLNPRDLVSVRGEVTPAIKFGPVYWGTHGPKSTYTTSCKATILEMNYTPSGADNGVPTYSLLPDNNAEDDSDLNQISMAKSSNVVTVTAPQVSAVTTDGNESDNGTFEENANPMADATSQPAAETPAAPEKKTRRVPAKSAAAK